MTNKTGNEIVDAFIEQLNLRTSDADSRHTEEGKEMMRKIRPALMLMAENDPKTFELELVKVLKRLGKIPNHNPYA